LAAHLVPALDAYARFHPEMSLEDAKGHLYLPDEPAVALVIEGDARSDSKGVVKTVDFLRDVSPPVADDIVPDVIFVTGDIVAPDAILEEYDSDWSPRLRVLGSVHVRTLLLYGSNSEIDGDLNAETVFGFYNHGSLRVRGTLRADVLLDSDYSWQVDGAVECRFILGDCDRANFAPTHPSEDIKKILVWDAVTDHDDVAYGFVWETLSRGDPILRPADQIGTPPIPDIGAIARARLAPLLERPEMVEEVDLSACQLRFVPEELLRFPQLKRLSLKDNLIKHLPVWISKLDRLECLNLESCGLTRVPPGLDALPTLREINLQGNAIKEAPESSGPLEALEQLTIGSRYHRPDESEEVTRFTALIDLAAFPRLRIANLVFGSDEIEYSDAARLWSTPTLENLTFDFAVPFTLPQHLAEATGLRVLNVSLDGDTVARSAAVLAQIPRLQVVNLNIFSKLNREQFDLICAAVPNAFVRRWSAFPEFSDEEKALVELTKSWSKKDATGLAAAETLLSTMEIRRCYRRCEALEDVLLFKTELLIESALEHGGTQRVQAADWGDHLLEQIPDIGDHLWRYPLKQLGYVRALASLCAILRPGDRAALARLTTTCEKLAREIGPAPTFMKDNVATWLDKTQSALSA
jgi:Leucine rich repeat